MMMRSILFAAAAAFSLTAVPVTAASYDAHSFYKNGKSNSSIKFSKYKSGELNRLQGATGKKKRKFLVENSKPSIGKFVTNGDTATLTGTVMNAAGEGFEIVMHFARVGDPGVYANRAKTSQKDWSYYTMTSGVLNSLTDGIASFDLTMRGKKRSGGKMVNMAGQFGTGANNKNLDMLGLFAKFSAQEQGCDSETEACESYNGKLKLVLTPNDDGAGANSDDDGSGVVPLPATALLLPVALGAFGIAGGVGRRRRKS